MTLTFKQALALLLCVPASAMADDLASDLATDLATKPAADFATDPGKPLWEAGVVIGALSAPEYRGSGRQRYYAAPLPYFIYRGEILKADENGLRGKFFDSDRVELTVSLGMSLPSDSSDHGPRHDMPDLKPVVEIGPSLQVNLWRNAAKTSRVDLQLPIRAAYALTGGTKYVGLISDPTLGVKFNSLAHSGWDLGIKAGPIFANARQHKYFYGVAPRYALPDRPAYKASGGYSGAQLVTSLARDFNRWSVGGFVRYDNLRGAAFDDSPLMEKKHSWMAGIGVSWKLGESSQRVARER
jgi:outer membrane scaffolding protein for murein synthesis (MipA/OmpV family)